MPIEWDAGAGQFHLVNGTISYLMGVAGSGRLEHLYFGPALHTGRGYGHLRRRPRVGRVDEVGDPVGLEVPTAGRGDRRPAALTVELADGSSVLDLAYVGHEILAGKPALHGLPAAYVDRDEDADTLAVVLRDGLSGLEVRLLTSIFRHLPVLTRSVNVRNAGDQPMVLTGIASAVLDLPDAEWCMLQLSGAWGREFQLASAPLLPGRRSVGSRLGSTGHDHDPLLLLQRPSTTETAGEALGITLVYSGNFLSAAEVGAFSTTRLSVGIQPEGFRWTLEPGEEFQAPEAVLVWSDEGIGGASEGLHRFFAGHLARGVWRDRPRPVVFNTWEATYFDYDETRLLALASAAREVGMEVFVLDDGWFGRRDDDTTSLGDWFADERKLPSGLGGLARRIRELGLDFGIWIEPEMVSPASRLYREHPDWAIGTPGRQPTTMRHQLVLDMTRSEVVDHLFGTLSGLLGSAPVSYVKWDMNRVITEPYAAALPGARQGEFFHRYILGVYDLWGRLVEAFPEVLFESCAAGGGRFDPGMLAFAPQGWTSDQTDPIDRLRIQWGASLAYPLSAIGAHVSGVPSHVVGRTTPLDTRAAVAFFGAFGYELDLTALTEQERSRVAEQIAWYRPRRELFQHGRFMRLRSPFEGAGNEVAWMSVDAAASHAVVGWYRVLARPLPGPSVLRLRGLDRDGRYRVTVWPESDDVLARANERVRGGDELMSVGLLLDDHAWEAQVRGDFQARIFELVRVAATDDTVADQGLGDAAARDPVAPTPTRGRPAARTEMRASRRCRTPI